MWRKSFVFNRQWVFCGSRGSKTHNTTRTISSLDLTYTKKRTSTTTWSPHQKPVTQFLSLLTLAKLIRNTQCLGPCCARYTIDTYNPNRRIWLLLRASSHHPIRII